MIYTDIPTPSEFAALDEARGTICVSLYLPTTPVTRATKGNRIAFKNLVGDVLEQLNSARRNKRHVSALQERLMELHDDDRFWAYLADGLAVFATPKEVRTFRLPIKPSSEAQVSDRFHIKPMVPVLSAMGSCFVLALSQGAVRLVEVTPSLAQAVKLPGMPKTLADAVKRQMPRDRAPRGRLQGSEGMKVLLGQFCRSVDRALRPVLSGKKTPLILASVNELAPIYRANNSYPHLAKSMLKGNPEQLSDQELGENARAVLKRLQRRYVADHLATMHAGLGDDLATTDIAQICRAAVQGQVQTLFVDTTAVVNGTVCPETGRLDLAESASASSYDVLDELVGLTLRHDGEVLPATTKAIGYDSPAAATLRYRA